MIVELLFRCCDGKGEWRVNGWRIFFHLEKDMKTLSSIVSLVIQLQFYSHSIYNLPAS